MKKLYDNVFPVLVTGAFAAVFTMSVIGIWKDFIRKPDLKTWTPHEIATYHSTGSGHYDFVLMSESAVSNAMMFGEMPPGWTSVCNNKGQFTARAPSGIVIDYVDANVRTSRYEAIIAAWRVKEVWDSPRLTADEAKEKQRIDWHDCDK